VPAWFLEMKTIDIIHAFAAFASFVNCLQGIYFSYTKTEQRPRIKVVIGLLPIALWLMIFGCIWGFTDWGWTHTGYACMLLFPVFSLMSSRQIVCNFTKMKLDPFPKSTLYFLLFPLNKYIVNYFRKSNLPSTIPLTSCFVSFD